MSILKTNASTTSGSDSRALALGPVCICVHSLSQNPSFPPRRARSHCTAQAGSEVLGGSHTVSPSSLGWGQSFCCSGRRLCAQRSWVRTSSSQISMASALPSLHQAPPGNCICPPLPRQLQQRHHLHQQPLLREHGFLSSICHPRPTGSKDSDLLHLFLTVSCIAFHQQDTVKCGIQMHWICLQWICLIFTMSSYVMRSCITYSHQHRQTAVWLTCVFAQIDEAWEDTGNH